MTTLHIKEEIPREQILEDHAVLNRALLRNVRVPTAGPSPRRDLLLQKGLHLRKERVHLPQEEGPLQRRDPGAQIVNEEIRGKDTAEDQEDPEGVDPVDEEADPVVDPAPLLDDGPDVKCA